MRKTSGASDAGNEECAVQNANSESEEEKHKAQSTKHKSQSVDTKSKSIKHKAKNENNGEDTADDADAVYEDDGAADATDPTDSEPDSAAAAQVELAAERDKYLRLAAEYDNFRKRSAKEREKAYSDAIADTVVRLLPVYDNLERALKMECADGAFYKGVEMTMTQLSEILEGMGIVPIKAAGEPFDPNRHNAVIAIENPELGEKIVAEEYQKGFMLGERIIRHSTVVVAN